MISPDLPRIELAVVGAHLTGMPLNRELIEHGAIFVRACSTAPQYRLFALAGTQPAKPGMLRVGDEGGTAIAIEVWSLTADQFGLFVGAIPAPLGIGTVQLEDGTSAKGFLVESIATPGARDISAYGGWRAYIEQQAAS